MISSGRHALKQFADMKIVEMAPPTTGGETAESPPAACPICGSVRSRPLFRSQGYGYIECKACSHAWMHPPPSLEAIEQIYDAAYFESASDGGYADYAADEALHRANARARLNLLAKMDCRPPGRMLDVGCALGYFADEARRIGWEVEGVEVSEWAAERARRTLGLQVHPSLVSALSPSARFDAITFFQSLEHMIDPMRGLREAQKALRPGGVVMIESWDRASLVARLLRSHWQQVSPPSVVHLFTRRGLANALAASGFSNPSVHTSSKLVSVRFVARLLGEKYPSLLAPLASRISEGRIGARGISYRLGDLVTAFARRES